MVALVEAPGGQVILAVTEGPQEWEMPLDFQEETDRDWRGCQVEGWLWVAIPIWTRLLVAMLLEARLVGENYPSF